MFPIRESLYLFRLFTDLLGGNFLEKGETILLGQFEKGDFVVAIHSGEFA